MVVVGVVSGCASSSPPSSATFLFVDFCEAVFLWLPASPPSAVLVRRRRRRWGVAAQVGTWSKGERRLAAIEDLTASEARKLWTWCIDPASSASRAEASVGMEVSGTCSCPPNTAAEWPFGDGAAEGDEGGERLEVVLSIMVDITSGEESEPSGPRFRFERWA